MEARLVMGAEINIAEHALLVSSLVRLGQRIGIDRVPRDVSPTLADYLDAGAGAEPVEVDARADGHPPDTPDSNERTTARRKPIAGRVSECDS